MKLLPYQKRLIESCQSGKSIRVMMRPRIRQRFVTFREAQEMLKTGEVDFQGEEMTYAELYETYYADVTQEQRDAVFHSWDVPTQMAWRIINEFVERRGFGSMWHEIDESDREDIFYAIKSIVTRVEDVDK